MHPFLCINVISGYFIEVFKGSVYDDIVSHVKVIMKKLSELLSVHLGSIVEQSNILKNIITLN